MKRFSPSFVLILALLIYNDALALSSLLPSIFNACQPTPYNALESPAIHSILGPHPSYLFWPISTKTQSAAPARTPPASSPSAGGFFDGPGPLRGGLLSAEGIGVASGRDGGGGGGETGQWELSSQLSSRLELSQDVLTAPRAWLGGRDGGGAGRTMSSDSSRSGGRSEEEGDESSEMEWEGERRH